MAISLSLRLVTPALFCLAALFSLPTDLRAQVVTPPAADATPEEAPSVKGPEGKADLPVARAKGSAGTLLFVHGGTGPVAGQYTKVMAAVQPGTAGAPADLAYDRFLGPLTMKSLGQVMTAMTAMYQKNWPKGKKIQLTFTDKIAPSELTPATLAAALAIDSMVRDYDIDPSYAAIGSINEEGMVDSVGGIPERLAAAARARVARIVVPEKNQSQVADYLLSEGIGAFVGTQIFTVQDFNQAGVLSLTRLDAGTTEVVKLFGAVQRTLAVKQGDAVTLLRSEATQGVLKKVLAAAPNHCSAQVLLDWGTGKKDKISFDGSVDVIDRRGMDLIRVLRAPAPEALKYPKEKLTDDIAALRFVLERLDTRTRPYAVSLLRFADALQQAVGTASRPPSKLTPRNAADAGHRAAAGERRVGEDGEGAAISEWHRDEVVSWRSGCKIEGFPPS